MKKYLLCLGFIMLALLIVSIPKTYGLKYQEENIITTSNELLNYINDHNLVNIKKICTYDYCDYLRSTNTTRAIAIFKEKALAYIAKEKNEESAIEARVKGFPITKIELFT